jgi:hypothetical protein
MTPFPSQRSHVARLFESLRLQRGLRPGELAARLGAANLSKVGGLIRTFELGEPICDHWLKKLVAELQPAPAELRRCLELDQAEATEQLQRERLAWEAWADQTIPPYLAIRRWPLSRGDEIKEVPWRFCISREQAEGWASAVLRRSRAAGSLNWSRRELTCYDKGGQHPRRVAVTFETCSAGASMKIGGSQHRLLLELTGGGITLIDGMGQPGQP